MLSIHRWTAHATLFFAFAAAGCAASVDEDEEEPASEAEIGASSMALESYATGRTRTNYPGAVFLEAIAPQVAMGTPIQWLRCSGAMIAPDLIMTAAHCVDTFPNGTALANGAVVQMAIEALVDGNRRCITDFVGADPNCLTTSELNDVAHVRDDMARVQIFRNTRYQPYDASTDVAVIKLLAYDELGNPQWSDTAKYIKQYFAGFGPDDECSASARQDLTPCYMRILNREPGGWFEWNGWGATRDDLTDYGAKLNFGVTGVDWVRSGHFGRDTQESDLERSCAGDSGGPAVVQNSAWGISGFRTYLMGIHHGTEGRTGQCANAGGKERWARVDTHTWLVTNSSTRATDPGAGRACEAASVNGHAYLKCWDVAEWLR